MVEKGGGTGYIWEQLGAVNHFLLFPTILARQTNRFCWVEFTGRGKASALTDTNVFRMSATMAKTDGPAVSTLTADPRQRRVKKTILSQSVLGILHLTVGLLNFGLGSILFCTYSWREMEYLGQPYWLGSVFTLFGITCILSEKCPNRCMVILNVILNILGLVFVATGICVHYFGLAAIQGRIAGWAWNGGHCFFTEYVTPLPAQQDFLTKKCEEGAALTKSLLISISVVLLVLAVLEIFITISAIVIGIKVLCSKRNKSNDDPVHYKTLLEEVANNPTE